MALQKKYTLADFSDFAFRYIDNGFETISSPDFCVWEHKNFAENDGKENGGYMILVGTYFYGSGMQSVWARATGLDVNYYHGLPSATRVVRVEDRFRYRIYFIDPFCYIAGPQDKGVNKERQHGQIITEAVINYLFLAQRYLTLVNSTGSTNMLVDFKLACINFESRKEEKQQQDRLKQVQVDANEQDQAPAREYEKRKRAGEFSRPYVKQEVTEEEEDDDDDELKRPRPFGTYGTNMYDFPHGKQSHPARHDANKKSNSSNPFTSYSPSKPKGVTKSTTWHDSNTQKKLQKHQSPFQKYTHIKTEYDDTSGLLDRLGIKPYQSGKYGGG